MDLPSDDEADALVREIRAVQFDLLSEPSRLMMLHANQRLVDDVRQWLARVADVPSRVARDALARLRHH